MEGAKSMPQGLNRLRKNSVTWERSTNNMPQGLKPWFVFESFAARLKSCPDTKPSQISFSVRFSVAWEAVT
jgi:hypothetical protein